MNQALQLGFISLINLTSFAGKPRSLRTGTLVPLRVRVMGSKRLLSNSTVPTKTDKKLKGIVNASANANSDMDHIKEGGEISKVIGHKTDGNAKGLTGSVPAAEEGVIKNIREEPSKIESMTVQELKIALRSAGVPAKGRKHELLSALRCYLDNKIEGASSHLACEQLSSVSTESLSITRMARKTSGEDHVQEINIVSEASQVRQSKRRVKQSPVQDKSVEMDPKVVKRKQKLSIKSGDTSGNKTSQKKRNLSEDIDSKEADNGATLLMNESEPWTIFAHKKPQKGWIAYNPRTMRPPPLTRNTKSVKLMSWNVNGLRALLKLGKYSALELAKRENFDVLCLQETKLQEKDVESIKHSLLDGYENSFWTCSASKLGYSGTAIISRIKPLSIKYGLGISDHDNEGRLVTAEFDSFYLLNAYVPNSGDGLRRLTYRITDWDPSLSNYMKELEKSKPVILTGDLNCAHDEIDIYNPAGNRRSAGFTDEERQSFGRNFLSRGFVDTFRKQHPDVVGYTYWGYRHGGRKTNKGWRLDYFLVSESIADKVHDSYILPDVMGSDHCPVALELKL